MKGYALLALHLIEEITPYIYGLLKLAQISNSELEDYAYTSKHSENWLILINGLVDGAEEFEHFSYAISQIRWS